MQSFWLLRVLPFVSLCRLHFQTCSHSNPRSVSLSRLLAELRAGRCAARRRARVRSTCTRASCAAKAGTKRRIVAPERSLRWCHQPSRPLHHLLHSPRHPQCSCLALVARVKEMANYGVAIAPPNCPVEEDLLLSLQQSSSSSRGQGGEAPVAPLIPAPIPATTMDVEAWMSGFKPLTNIRSKCPPEVGDSILWRGVKSGPRG